MRLPEAFRSLSRPSSAPSAKAFTSCSFLLDLYVVAFLLSLLEVFISKVFLFSIFDSYFFLVFSFQGASGLLEPVTGEYEIRTRDPLLARQVLSQLS